MEWKKPDNVYIGNEYMYCLYCGWIPPSEKTFNENLYRGGIVLIPVSP